MPIGCPDEYQVMVMRQPGNMTLQDVTPVAWGELTEILSLTWGRILNGTYTASVSVSKCPNNCQLFITSDDPENNTIGIRPWAFEIWFYRDGLRAFEGPIVYIRETPDRFILDIQDMTGWVARREIINYYTNTGDAATIAKNLLDTFFPPTDPALLIYSVLLGTSIGTLTVEYDRAQYVIMQKWQDLVTAGLNFTTFGRYILLFGQEPPNLTGPYYIDIDDVLGDVEIVQDGINFGTHIVGLGEGLASGIGPSASDLAFYGKVTYPPTRFNNVRSQLQLDNLVAAFYDRQRDLTPQLVVPSQSALSASTEIFSTGYTLQTLDPMALPDLIPGYRYDLQVKEPFCQPGRFPMRLGELKVTWDPQNGERVMVSFTDLGVQPE